MWYDNGIKIGLIVSLLQKTLNTNCFFEKRIEKQSDTEAFSQKAVRKALEGEVMQWNRLYPKKSLLSNISGDV